MATVNNFTAKTYIERRSQLKKSVKSGVILLLGNIESPINYAKRVYPFRQDSNFLYYFGIEVPKLAGIIDIDNDETIIFGDEQDPSELIWSGPVPTLAELTAKAGVTKKTRIAALPEYIQKILSQKRQLHITPVYRDDTLLELTKLLHVAPDNIDQYVSPVLVNAIVTQRSCKSALEVAEIKSAIKISAKIYKAAQKMLKPGIYEYEILAEFERIATANKTRFAFDPTISVHGEFLHNPNYNNKLKKGQLLLVDSGVESLHHYASDITRTYPVSGKMTAKQQAIYDLVLDTQLKIIKAIKPGVAYQDLHLAAARNIFAGLKALNLTKGNVDEAIEHGAFTLFYTHGLGHMLGLDTHDMRGLGDHAPGYDKTYRPQNKPGFSVLRLARELKENFVLTVEPGIYFVPMLIDQWQAQNKFNEFINYDELKHYRNFGGIRIEDNVLITKNGVKVLSKEIN